jgi:hypothetical protein
MTEWNCMKSQLNNYIEIYLQYYRSLVRMSVYCTEHTASWRRRILKDDMSSRNETQIRFWRGSDQWLETSRGWPLRQTLVFVVFHWHTVAGHICWSGNRQLTNTDNIASNKLPIVDFRPPSSSDNFRLLVVTDKQKVVNYQLFRYFRTSVTSDTNRQSDRQRNRHTEGHIDISTDRDRQASRHTNRQTETTNKNKQTGK